MFEIQLPKAPLCLRITNWTRLVQFLFKAVLAWYLIVSTYKNLYDSFQTAQWVLGLIGFGVVYMLWRFHSLYIRTNEYHLQWSFALFDITATILIKTSMLTSPLRLNNDSLKLANNVLASITCSYLILPFLIFMATFYMYCRVRRASNKMGGGLGGAFGQVFNSMTGTMGIQFFSQQHGCFRFLVYVNVFIAGALAIFSVIVTIAYMTRYSSFDSVFGVLVIFELIDIVINFIEDRIICSYAKEDAGNFLPEIPFPPFECCACGAFPNMNREVHMGGGMGQPLIQMNL